jgi:hypothetical protein
VILVALASPEFPPVGGLFLGCIVAVIGGVMAIVGTAPAPIAPRPPPSGPLPLGPWKLGPGTPMLPPCPFCGHPNPWRASVCEQCDSPLM